MVMAKVANFGNFGSGNFGNHVRFFEIDALRGIAVIAMIAFHALFALNFLAGYCFELNSGLFLLMGRFASVAFIFLVGISLTLSYNKAKKHKQSIAIFSKYLFRGLWIFFLGLLITLITFLAFPEFPVLFGVLQCIGLSIILAFPFLAFRRLKGNAEIFFLGWLFITAGVFLSEISIQTPWLLWLGLKPIGFQTLDYFPLLPWFGLVLLGIFAGNILYPDGKRSFVLSDASPNPLIALFSFLGRYSLVIYFLHFPILVAIVELLA